MTPLHLDGLDLRNAALLDRKQELAALLADTAEPIRFSDHVEADGAVVYQNACRLELEGGCLEAHRWPLLVRPQSRMV